MTNNDNPYLCGGTFLAQILRARKSSELSAYYNRNKKESLSEQETFRRLISIYHMAEFSSCSSLKTYTSQFKSCTNSLESFALFSDSDVKREFDSDVRSADSSALTMMSDFVQEFIDTEKYIQLVRCLLDMIENDSTIAPNTPLYILENTPMEKLYSENKVEILELEEYFDIVEEAIRILPDEAVIHRFTGDGPKKILIAPEWTKNKRQVINYINRRFGL